ELLVGPRTLRDRVDDELGGEAAGDDHRAAGEEGRPVDRAAPEHEAVPARRSLIGKELVADHRMDAVGADQHVAASGVAVRSVAVEEVGGDAAIVLPERLQAAIEMDARFAEPRAHGLVDHALQPAAMDRELRDVVAGVEAARLAP